MKGITYLKRIAVAIVLRVEWRIITLLMYILRVFPVKNNKVIFMNYFGKGYGDNSKYICEQLLTMNSKLDIVWVLQDMNEHMPKEIRKIKYKSLQYFYEMCTAKVWVDNCRKPLYMRKRKSQYYIQTWHADMGIKKAEGDAEKALYPSYIKGAKNDSKMADLFVSGNEWMVNRYRNAYWYNGEICKCGYPRRDILYNISDFKKEKIKEKLGIGKDQKILLYAPTFRKKFDLNVYTIEWEKILKVLSETFEGSWMGMIRLHPNISRYSRDLNFPNTVIDVTNYPDMQELLAISNICITDYSSAILEFAVTGKPAFIYACDYEEYKKDRDVYFDLKELPFPFAETNEELILKIANFNKKEYKHKNSEFYQSEMGLFEKGQSSEILAEIIEKKCLGNSNN